MTVQKPQESDAFVTKCVGHLEQHSERSSERLEGLPPVVGVAPRVLVLGSMPSEASLKAQAYYAHPRNRFWPVAGALLGFDFRVPYEARIAAYVAAGGALWDTIGRCERTGSLDSAILCPEPNPIGAFLAQHPTIQKVLLNGGLAQRMWLRHVAPRLPADLSVEVFAMPSTSPANARWTLPKLIDAWRPGFE